MNALTLSSQVMNSFYKAPQSCYRRTPKDSTTKLVKVLGINKLSEICPCGHGSVRRIFIDSDRTVKMRVEYT